MRAVEEITRLAVIALLAVTLQGCPARWQPRISRASWNR